MFKPHHSLLALSWMFVGGFAASGCASHGEPSPASDADYDDVAQALGGVAATDNQGGEVGTIHDATSIAFGAPRLGLLIDASGKFTGKHGSLEYAYETTCRDSAGEEQKLCDANTDSAMVRVDWSGELDTPNLDASIEHEGELHIIDLKSNVASVSGDGSFDYDATFRSAFSDLERTYHLSYDATYRDLQVSRVPMAIVGGNAHYVIDAERMVATDEHDSDKMLHMDAVVEFAADGTALLTIDGTHEYTLDTRNGVVSK